MAIIFAVSLVLILVWSQESTACSRVYRFISEMHNDDQINNVDRVVYGACGSEKNGTTPSIRWNELSRRISWPLGESHSKELIIIDEDLPEVVAVFEILKKEGSRVQIKGCDIYIVTITGKQSLVQNQDVGTLIQGIRLEGHGKALICGNSSLPDAVSMKLKRVIEPTLWSEVDSEVVEEIKVAWSLMP